MKKLEINKTVKEISYEAIDGTRFTSESECKKYEESAKCLLLFKYNSLVIKKDIREADFYDVGCEEDYIDIVKLTKDSDLDIIMQLFCLFNPHAASDESRLTKINQDCEDAIAYNDYLIIYRGYDMEKGNFWVRGTIRSLFNHMYSFTENENNKS
jgi:hypothetical protein